jgi:P-type Cu2+ transporter
MGASCALCEQPVENQSVLDEDRAFCCFGCRSVYTILKAKGELSDVRHHPLFKTAAKEGIISNPNVLKEIQESSKNENEQHKLYLEVEDLWCTSCCEVIKILLTRKTGIDHCHIDYATDLGVVVFNPRYFAKHEVLSLIKSYGYEARELSDPSTNKVHKKLLLRLFISLFFALNIMMCSWPIYGSYFYEDQSPISHLLSMASFACSLPIIGFCAVPIFKKAWLFMTQGILGMELLVSIGVLSSFVLSTYNLIQNSLNIYFDSMSVIVTFVLLGKVIESKAKFSTKSALFFLHKSLPKKARLIKENGEEEYVPLKDVSKGELLLVKQGEQIPLDGKIEEGKALVDEAVMTGESVPHIRQKEDCVVGGSLVKQGNITLRALTTYRTSSLAKVVDWIEKQLEQKVDNYNFVDPIVRWFVPAVLLCAFGTFIVDFTFLQKTLSESFLNTLSVLLISCPCAIGIAAPLAESMQMHRLAKEGILVRNRKALPFLSQVDVLCFDKTGTLTKGIFKVIKGLKDLDKEDLSLLKGICNFSIHPIAKAIDKEISLEKTKPDSIQEVSGRGMLARFGETTYHLGSKIWLKQEGIAFDERDFQTHGVTTVGLAKDGDLLTVISLGDELREDVPGLIKRVKKYLKSIVLISGDGKEIVEDLAKTQGFSSCFYEVTPLEKKDIIDDLKEKGHCLAMVGDGVNDALALASAQCGIAMMNASDLSLQVCDFLITKQKVDVVDTLLCVGRKGKRIILQNLFWAFFYNVIGVFLAMMGVLIPVFAAFAMVASSLIVLGNSLRIKRIRMY